MPALLIHDSLTLSETIPATGPWPAVTIQYRPALPKRVMDYQKAAKLTGQQQMDAMSKILEEHLVGWDITQVDPRTKEEQACPVNKVNLEHVPHPILEAMLDYVTGYGPAKHHDDEKN